MRAVSIKMPNGKTITLMPFSSIEVKRGSKVVEGQSLGTLAASGDVSSEGAHLHMGLKEGRTYYDPMSLFGRSSTPKTELSAERSGEAAASAAPGVRADAVPVPATQEESEPAADTAAETEAATVTESKAQQLARSAKTADAASDAREPEAEWEPGTVSSGNVDWNPAEDEEGSPFATIRAALEPILSACSWQVGALIAGLGSLSQNTGVPLTAVYLGALALAIVALTFVIWAFATWVLPFVSSLWRKANSAWSSRKKSGRLLGLFPAPGSAFITRGR